ncbi:Tim44 domain-containing protein [Halomonas caseinilytica]|uniref:Tim44 domain-containing protein n=1 Tax=Halomonas caseinilytica TaxID=438744 RepID=UPI0007E54D6A|nr:TIM44-like domain-containing protein [Halomonas caseinilytica]SEN06994.1 Predicted lipid-binding transport protein, Tim44 family [Halomonas caseinilytica]
MRHFLVMLIVGMFGFGLAVDHADARRLGGGKSVGSYSRTISPQNNTSRATAAPQRKPSSGLSRFAGPFAGLLAGGLLASLFFGGAFDELRMMDLLLIAGVAFLLFRLLARRRTATAGAHDTTPHAAREPGPQAFQSSSSAGSSANLAGEPDWFDKERFLSGAKEHFMTLQRAWDNNDFTLIQDYVTPELYNLLRQEREQHPANNHTEIVRLVAELGHVIETDQQAEASVLFHGILDENGEHNEFNETWHLIRDRRDGAPWYVQGIEQNPA